MRKHSTLSLALAVLLASGGAHSATIYDKQGTQLDAFGYVQATFTNRHGARLLDNDGAAHSDNTLLSEVRMGFAGRSEFADNWAAVAMADMDFSPAGNGTVKSRYCFAGIDGGSYGTLTFGRGDGAFYTVAGVTDIFHKLDTRANEYYSFGDQTSGQIMYSLSTLGWDLRISVQTAMDNLNDTFSVDEALQVALATRTASGFGIAYGYSLINLTYEGEQLSREDGAHQMFSHFLPALRYQYPDYDYSALVSARPRHRHDLGIALTYGTFGDGLYAALLFSSSKYQNYHHHLYSYEAVVSYAWDCGVTLSAGYAQQRFGKRLRTVSDLHFSLSYAPVPQMVIYAEAQLDLSSEPEKFYGDDWIAKYQLGEDKYVLGVQYSF